MFVGGCGGKFYIRVKKVGIGGFVGCLVEIVIGVVWCWGIGRELGCYLLVCVVEMGLGCFVM